MWPTYGGCHPSDSLPLFEFVYVLCLLLIWRIKFSLSLSLSLYSYCRVLSGTQTVRESFKWSVSHKIPDQTWQWVIFCDPWPAWPTTHWRIVSSASAESSTDVGLSVWTWKEVVFYGPPCTVCSTDRWTVESWRQILWCVTSHTCLTFQPVYRVAR